MQILFDHPEQRDSFNLWLAHALKTVGQVPEAIDEYRAAAAARPNFGDAYWSLANLKLYRFSDAEMDRIYAACDALGGPKPAGPGHREWGGEDVRDFIMLSVFTGLRISDVATFNIAERLKGNDVFLRMHKTQRELYTWIPDWLVHRLREREKRYGALIFRTGQSLEMRTMAELWRNKLAKVFSLAGPFEEKPTPHRCRHTFVRMLLEKGVPPSDVAELIGDTEDDVRRHYAKWVPERQARLTKILKDAFDGRRKPKLLAMPGGRA